MTTLDLDGIRLRRDNYRPHETDCWQRGWSCCTAHTSAEDVPALIAEVDRLRAALAAKDELSSHAAMEGCEACVGTDDDPPAISQCANVQRWRALVAAARGDS